MDNEAVNKRASDECTERVWVMLGGSGPEREGSLLSGTDVSAALELLGIDHGVVDLVDIESHHFTPEQTLFLTTHGQWGEDGKLQGYLETLRVRYTGSGVLASAVTMHKTHANLVAIDAGMVVPAWIQIDRSTSQQAVEGFFDRHGSRLILRPTSGGGSLGVAIVESVEEVVAAVQRPTWSHAEYLLNPYIEGAEVTYACLLGADGEFVQFPALETEFEGDIYDYDIKHDDALRRHWCPARISETSNKQIRNSSEVLYRSMGLNGFARFDFIVAEDGTPWFLEVNSLPGFSQHGNLATMAEAAGVDYTEVVQRQLASAYRPGAYEA